MELWLTEGIKKADALADHGLCAVALLGVWNFKGKNEFGGVTLVNDFDYIAWNGRSVRIVFDSDLMQKKGSWQFAANDSKRHVSVSLSVEGGSVPPWSLVFFWQ